jgi:ribosomal protein S18 acetylase RimI-like enzyme
VSAPPARLRAATAADVARLCLLMQQNYAEAGYPFDPAAARACFSALLRDPELGQTWLVEIGSEIVGYAVLALGFSLEYRGRDAFVDDLYLVPARRGGGLGRLAMDAVEAAARERGVVALHLEVERDNARAQALYRRLGYGDKDRKLLTKLLAPQDDAAHARQTSER